MTPDQVIWQSAQNLLKSQCNLDKLYEALHAVECEDADLLIEFESSDSDGEDWVTPVWSSYYSVKMRSQRNMVKVGWITLTIQLTVNESSDETWEHGRRAKVLAGFSPMKKLEHAWVFDLSSPDSSGKCEDCEVDAYRWVMSDNGVDSWFFSVPLDALTNTSRVEKCIADPMKRMIRGESANSVLSGIDEFLCKPPQQR